MQFTDETKLEALYEKDDFVVFIPNTVEFGIEKAEKPGAAPKRWIGGYCSTELKDRQDEVVVQKGLDFTDFINYGYFNDNHKQDTDAILGVPTEVKLHAGRGWWTKGYLLNTSRSARIWEVAKALAETDDRRFGFSIEGKVQERSSNRIVRAKVRNVAVTNCPVNTSCTWDILVKAFAPAAEIESCYDRVTGEACACHLPNAAKALSAGHGNPPVSGGRVLQGEDLDGSRKKLKVVTSHSRKSELTVGEAIDMLERIRPHYSPETRSRIVNLALRMEALR